ncbi:type II secretion system F family protein [Actinoplanes sp. NPDC026619]|uniref:type II secretion system F family protein n=1 Tax=Actinoplanes sp. NPDC026619 TaxID=3155798 RepID=UPI0033F2F793
MSAPLLLAIAAVCAALAVSLAATAVGIPPTQRERMLKILSEFGENRITDTRPPKPTLYNRVRPGLLWFFQHTGDLITPPAMKLRLARQLDYAGNPPAWPVDRVVQARMFGVIFFAVVGYVIYPKHAALSGLAGIVIGLVLPELLVRNLGQKRQQALARSLPDVLDALVIGVEAGLGLDAALAQVAQMQQGPMPDEVRRLLQEMQLGVSRTDALRALSARTTSLDLKRMITALVQAGEMGISVAGILREHAADQRLRRRQRAEESAQKVAIKLLFPVLFCLFPVIFVVVLGPAILTVMANFG